MKVLIDIKHPAQSNLFKGLAHQLQNEGWDVTITYLRRGKLPRIIEEEYKEFDNKIAVGTSSGTKWSIFWSGNVIRTLTFFKLILQKKYHITIAASSIPLAFASWFTGTPVIQFYDDPERKSVNKLNRFFSTKMFFPPIVKRDKKLNTFNCLKEWSYLSPARFIPDNSVLTNYGLTENEYVFIREVSNKSFNYFDQEQAIIKSFANKIKPGIKVLLSLEDKSLALQYPADWIILREPVNNIHSLIYYSRLMISSGDSMAREGAMLGVPSIYCGIREMKANKLLLNKGLMHHFPGDTGLNMINDVITKPFDQAWQTGVREDLRQEWDDMVTFMHEQVKFYARKPKALVKPTFSPST